LYESLAADAHSVRPSNYITPTELRQLRVRDTREHSRFRNLGSGATRTHRERRRNRSDYRLRLLWLRQMGALPRGRAAESRPRCACAHLCLTQRRLGRMGYVVAWTGLYTGVVEDSSEKLLDEKAGHRPPTTATSSTDNARGWGVFWRVRHLRQLSAAERRELREPPILSNWQGS
jgi:hypothetical protein